MFFSPRVQGIFLGSYPVSTDLSMGTLNSLPKTEDEIDYNLFGEEAPLGGTQDNDDWEDDDDDDWDDD